MSSNPRFILAAASLVTASILSSVGWVLEGEAVLRILPLPAISVALLVGGICVSLVAARFTPVPNRARIAEFRWQILAFSILRSSICSLIFGFSLMLTSASKAMFLTKIEPYLVLLLQVVFHGHRTTPWHLFLLAIHLGGAVLLSTGGAISFSESIAGDLLIFTGVLLHALTYAPAQKLSCEFGALWTSGITQILGGAVLLPFALWFSPESFSFAPPYETGWWYLAGTVVVFYILSTSLWMYSLKEVPAWLASALRCVGPVFAAPLAWVFFSKTLDGVQMLGASIVVGTSIAMVVSERRSGKRS